MTFAICLRAVNGVNRAIISRCARALGWKLEQLSITGDETLSAAYGVRIPVLRTPSGAELGWPFSPGQVRRLLAAEA